MGTIHSKPFFTPEEYLAREEASTDKHEYFQGEIFAMAGGSERHSLITTNTITALSYRLRGGSCRVYDSNLKVKVPATTLYTYPDVTVICGPVEYDPVDLSRGTALNPTLIVEVLSPSTEGYDRGRKFANYLQIGSLREYVLIEQETPRVERLLPQSDGTWSHAFSNGLEAQVHFAAFNITVPLAEIYFGVDFDPDSGSAISS